MPKRKISARTGKISKINWIFVLSWVFGILLLFNGFRDLHRSVIAGVLGILSGLFLTPFTWQKITEYTKWHPIKEVRIVLVALAFWFSVLF